MVVPGDSDLELCRAHIERLRQVRGGAWACPRGPPPAQVLMASSPGLCLSCQEPEGAGAKSPMCQKLSPKWCFLDGEWPPKGWGLPPPLKVLGGAAGDPGLDRGPPSSASPLPTATTASRFYRIDRAQVRTQGLLWKPLAPGPVSPVLLGRPARACSPVSADGQYTGTVLTAGSWAHGVGLWGSLKAQASSSQTQKERRFGSEAGHPVKA